MKNFPYYNVLDQIYHAEWSTAKLARLELLRRSIADLWPQGHPTRLVHVVGTGGKGSTCRFLETGFGLVGKAGAFMSPHLFDYRERFSIGGEFVSQADVQRAWEQVVQPYCVAKAVGHPEHAHTFHEVSILIALTLFERYGVEWAALESGIGGRYDQTRALETVATALTNVGSDHANLLGDEQWQRTLDKAGAARSRTPFFTSDVNPANLEVISSVCHDVGSPLTRITATEVQALEAAAERAHLDIGAESLLHAPYQKWNATLAAAVIQHFHPELSLEQMVSAFATAQLLGRFWKVEDYIYADIAHNYEKINALAGEIRAQFGDTGKILILGMSGKRLPGRIFGALAKMAKTIIVTGASYKGLDPGKVAAEVSSLAGDTPTFVVADPRHALEAARAMRQSEDVILLTGSTYMIEQALNPDPYLRSLGSSFGWRLHHSAEASGTVNLTMPPPPPPIR